MALSYPVHAVAGVLVEAMDYRVEGYGTFLSCPSTLMDPLARFINRVEVYMLYKMNSAP